MDLDASEICVIFLIFNSVVQFNATTDSQNLLPSFCITEMLGTDLENDTCERKCGIFKTIIWCKYYGAHI